MLRINSYTANSEIYGINEPAFALWVQGCSIKCKGCYNKHMWASKGGIEISQHELLDKIIKSGDLCVTILGGEPSDQAEEINKLIKLIREKTNKGIILYTGKEYNEACKLPGFLDVDVLVTGPYIEKFRDINDHMRGSFNQEVHYLTSRYKKENVQKGTYVKIIVDKETGEIKIQGYPDDFFNIFN